MKKKQYEYTVLIHIKSKIKEAPKVNTLCGDTMFVYLQEGQTASYSVWKGKRKLLPKTPSPKSER
jgi:hypothetical protein